MDGSVVRPGEAAQNTMEDLCLSTTSTVVCTGWEWEEKTAVRDGAHQWEGFWLPSQSCTEVRSTAARCQDGVWRRTWFPATGLLAEPPLLEPAGGLSSMGVQEGGYISWGGFWLLSRSHTGARHTAPRCL